MRKPSILTLALLLLATCALPAFAGWDEGVAAFKAKDYNTAAREFQKLADQSPSYQVHYMLGLTLQRLDRKEESLNQLRKAYDLNPNDVAVKMELGKAYFVTRRYDEVEKLFGTIDPSSMPAAQRAAFYQMRAEAKLKRGNSGGALSDFRQLAKLQPDNGDVHYKMAAIALKDGQVDTALSSYEQAVRLDPNDVAKKRAYASALIRKGQATNDKAAKRSAYAKASSLAKVVVASDASFDNLMLQMSAELGAGEYAAAAKTGERAQAKNGSDWIVPFYIGQAYTSDGKYTQAEAPLRKALQLAATDKDKRNVWRQIGFSLEKQKRYAESIEAYGNANDQAGADRVAKNQEIAEDNKDIEAQNAQIRAMEEEAKRLEDELKQLETGGGGSGGEF